MSCFLSYESLCGECGLPVFNQMLHACNPAVVEKHQVKLFEKEYARWLVSPEGKFAAYLANLEHKE